MILEAMYEERVYMILDLEHKNDGSEPIRCIGNEDTLKNIRKRLFPNADRFQVWSVIIRPEFRVEE